MSMQPLKHKSIWEIIKEADQMRSSGMAVGTYLSAKHNNKRIPRLKAAKNKR